MKRRDFIRKAVSWVPFQVLPMTLGNYRSLFAHEANQLCAALIWLPSRVENPVEMFDKAIASLGGMKQFVQAQPDRRFKTKYRLHTPRKGCEPIQFWSAALWNICKMAGAKAVYVFDNTCNEWTRCTKTAVLRTP